MKVALCHDWLTGFRGGERVLESFCELFPDAPIYTLIHKAGTTSELTDSKKIYSSHLNKIPKIESHYRKLLPTFPGVVKAFKIEEEFDLVLSSSHCVIKGLKKPRGSKHISYIHSPMRYMYDQFDSYFGKNAPLYQQFGAKAFRNYLVNWDKKSNENVDHMIANSHFVRERISQYYNRNSEVIHPFVDLKDFTEVINSPKDKEDYFVIVSAFAPNKRVDLAIRAFNKLGKKLKIVGSGQQERVLKTLANSNIEFLGSLSRSEVIETLSKAKALIFPGIEDFGIVPLESLASGTPVIAFKSGGVLETLTDETALFFNKPTVDSLNEAVEEFESKKFIHQDLMNRAQDFSKENFKEKMLKYISNQMEI